jgi:hypothetical protein
MQHGVRVVADAEQEHLPAEIVHAADGAPRDVRRQRQRPGGDPGPLRPGRREGVHVIAAHHARQAVEGLGDDAEVRRGRRQGGVERALVVAGPGRHDERAALAERIAKGRDQPRRPALDRPHGAKRGVDEQDPARLDAEGAELPGEIGPARRTARGLRHARHLPIVGALRLAPRLAARYSTRSRGWGG